MPGLLVLRIICCLSLVFACSVVSANEQCGIDAFTGSAYSLPPAGDQKPVAPFQLALRNSWPIRFGTSNVDKRSEFSRVIGNRFSIEFQDWEIHEIDADHLTVTVHKASLTPQNIDVSRPEIFLVEDSSLEIEGESWGVNVKYYVHQIEQHIGKKARWDVNVAYRFGGYVWVYIGSVSGVIVPRQSPGDSFTNYFLPNGSSKTLSLLGPENGPRQQVINKLLAGEFSSRQAVMGEWNGPYQPDPSVGKK